MEATPIATATAALASRTRPRCGTRVNVVSPVRWLHSEVTARIATIGRITDIGAPMAAANDSYVWSDSGAKAITAAVASSAVIPMLAISQKPERVSKTLVSSTHNRRRIGIREGGPAGTGAAWEVRVVASRTALMLRLLRSWRPAGTRP